MSEPERKIEAEEAPSRLPDSQGQTNPIAAALLAWWDAGHADLPWRRTRDAYAIWIAEIMLQQTQIATVIPYYERWMARFPNVEALAAAPLADVLKVWEGLGYYSRARHVHAAAQQVRRDYGGLVPRAVSELLKLPGIGRYTAGAVASIAYGVAAPVLDGNVMRVLSRVFDIAEDVTRPATRKQLWQLAGRLVPEERPGDFNEALMELGQQVCTPQNPRCLICPLNHLCLARQRGTQLERPVRPPRKRTPHYDVVAAIIWESGSPTRNGRFLITQRPLAGLLGGLWEFPGGKAEPGETLPETIRREIREELALAVEPGDFLIAIDHAFTHFRITVHAFHTAYTGGDPQHLAVADHAWVTLDELDRYAFAVTNRRIIAQLRATL